MTLRQIENPWLRRALVVAACALYVPFALIAAAFIGASERVWQASIALPDAVRSAWSGPKVQV